MKWDDTTCQTDLYKHTRMKTSKYKMISEERLDMNKTLYKTCGYIHNINTRIKNRQNKSTLNKTK